MGVESHSRNMSIRQFNYCGIFSDDLTFFADRNDWKTLAWGTDLDCVTTDVSDTVTSDDVMSEGSEEMVMVINIVMIWIKLDLHWELCFTKVKLWHHSNVMFCAKMQVNKIKNTYIHKHTYIYIYIYIYTHIILNV